MYQHILIATDGPELATRALEHGLALAKRDGAQVTIVTVTEVWSPFEMAQEAREHRPDPVGQFEALRLQQRNTYLMMLRRRQRQSASRAISFM